MRGLELKSIKHSALASQETYCYQANLYLDKKKIAEVGNSGCGGCDFQYTVKDNEKDFNRVLKHFGDRSELEYWCSKQVTDFLISKDLKRLLKTRILFIKNKNQLYEVKLPRKSQNPLSFFIALVEQRNPEAKILNSLPFSKALEAYKGITL